MFFVFIFWLILGDPGTITGRDPEKRIGAMEGCTKVYKDVRLSERRKVTRKFTKDAQVFCKLFVQAFVASIFSSRTN